MKKKKFIIPIVAGFLVLYMVIMAGATWLVQQKYLEEFKLYYDEQVAMGDDYYQSIDKQIHDGDVSDKEQEYWITMSPFTFTELRPIPYQQFSAAFYNAETGESHIVYDRLGNGYTVSDLLTDEEIQTLVEYRLAVYQDKEPAEPYRFYGMYLKETNELCKILVQKVIWEKNGNSEGKSDSVTGGTKSQSQTDDKGHTDRYVQIDDEIVWEWVNPDFEGTAEWEMEAAGLGMIFPYLYQGYDSWQKWKQSDFLQSAMRDVDWEQEIDLENIPEWRAQYSFVYTIYSEIDNHIIGRLMLASECHPWLAAMDYMKYVYLTGLLLMAACMAAVIHSTGKTYAQREALDEARRDFTNAMAHEMKTPLGIIRGFAENLQENTVEEKRDYYLDRIIEQTEEMDRLVAEMIDVSKLDSEHLVLQKDTLSLNELVKAQIPKFQPVTDAKQLQIILEERAVFEIVGDRKYISKAIGNLLDNAVCYCNQNSVIRIVVEAGLCTIENDCAPVTEEKLKHMFELYYQGNQSSPRTASTERHLGVGLYLTRKILKLHHMQITMENTQTGVIVKVRK